MKNILIWTMIFFQFYCVSGIEKDINKTEKEYGFHPINKEIPLRFHDQDICEIIWGEELRDCTGFPEGSPSPDPDEEDSHKLVSYEETK